MAIWDRFSGIFQRNKKRTSSDETATITNRQGHTAALDLAEMFREESERADIIKTCRQMYKTDTRARKIIQTLARDATKGGFQVEFEDENAPGVKEALEIVEALRDRLKLNKRLDDWARLSFRDGDSLLELGVTTEGDIEEVTRKPTLNMHRNSNKWDKFDDPSKAFWYGDSTYTADMAPRDALWFPEWVIIHARLDHDEGEKYGMPLLAVARGPWKRVKEGEIDISVRRKTRAGIKFAHILKGADATKIAEYQRINAAALNNPLAAALDYFMNSDGDIKVIEGDANLGQMGDVQHHVNTFWLASPVPESIAGVGNQVDFSVVGHQKEQYEETLGQVQEWISDQFIVPLLETQWLLKGILPETLGYKITWPVKKQVTPTDILQIADAATKLRALGVPEEVVVSLLVRYLPGISREMLAEMNDPNAENGSDRLAGILDDLIKQMAGDGGSNQTGQGKGKLPNPQNGNGAMRPQNGKEPITANEERWNRALWKPSRIPAEMN